MKLLTAFVLLVSLALTASVPPAIAQSMADQKACAEAAQKAFDDYKATDWHTDRTASLESHFNNQLHICVALVTTTSSTPHPLAFKTLSDAIGGHQFAHYMWENREDKHYWEVKPYACSFEKTPYGPASACNTAEEFDAAVQLYMTT